MIPAPVRYTAPDTLDEAVNLLAEHGDDARPLAGGQSLLPMLRFRLVTPALLVDLRHLADIRRLERVNGTVEIGALATHHDVGSAAALARLAMFADAAEHIGDVQVRNWGTFVGALAHADPAGDWPAVALAADTTLHIASPSGTRAPSIDGFVRYAFTPGLDAGELVTGAWIPLPTSVTTSAYAKIAHPASGYALAGVAACLAVADGTVLKARIAATGVTATPTRLRATEASLTGRVLSNHSITAAAGAAPTGLQLLPDESTSADYRHHLLSVACERALARAQARLSSEGAPSVPHDNARLANNK